MNTTYKDAGVNIDAGNEAVDKIKKYVKSTYNDHVLTQYGAFGGGFEFNNSDYHSPVLVSSADGVGTKLMVAIQYGQHDTIGQCLVNHCVNDILVMGAVPLFFLDYFAAGKLNTTTFESVVKGLSTACRENDCVLIGGETAEMPGMYKDNDYDLSGTIVGVVEKNRILSNRTISAGDLLIGLPSNGLHTNGYSLARKVFEGVIDYDDHVPELETSLGSELLRTHRSYLPLIKPILENDWLHGISHITGGGLIENTNRIIPENLSLKIDWDAWEIPIIFNLIREIGKVPDTDLKRTFNCGIGLVLIVNPKYLSELSHFLDSAGETWYEIGSVSRA